VRLFFYEIYATQLCNKNNQKNFIYYFFNYHKYILQYLEYNYFDLGKSNIKKTTSQYY
jgi:hypothetical protein